MKKFIVLTVLCFVLIGCTKSIDHSVHDGNHEHTENAKNASTENVTYTLEYRNEPQFIVSGDQTKLIFTVKDLNGEVVKDLEIVHEKPMHLLIVSEDLSEFYHVHPEAQADGAWGVNFTFPNGGKYRLFADFTPKGGAQSVRDFPVQVSGGLKENQPLKVDEKFEKILNGSRLVMEAPELSSNKETMLNFSVYDAASGDLASGVEKYLGESAHFVIISQDLKNFVHAHPMSMDNAKSDDPKLANAPANSRFSAHVVFPSDGIYKIFVEFKRSGAVTAFPFVVNVKKGSSDRIMEKAEIPEGAYKITVSKDGFAPNEINLSRDKFQKLAFLRVDSENCADEIVFKDLNIRKKLPVGEVVLVDIPKDKTGEISFACGMDMFKGKVIIQ